MINEIRAEKLRQEERERKAAEEALKAAEESKRRKIAELKERGNSGYYEYTALSLVDSDGGAIDANTVTETLNNYALDGWRLVSGYANELGHNSTSAGIAGFSTQKNSTIDQHILILERYIRI